MPFMQGDLERIAEFYNIIESHKEHEYAAKAFNVKTGDAVWQAKQECWLDISGTEHIYGSPERVANEIM